MKDAFFDTNIIIDWLRRRPQARAEFLNHETFRISRLTWAEVLTGEVPNDRAGVASLLSHFEIFEVTPEIATRAVDVRYDTGIKLLDAIIFATAQVNDGVLITRDTKAFRPGTPGVHIPYTL